MALANVGKVALDSQAPAYNPFELKRSAATVFGEVNNKEDEIRGVFSTMLNRQNIGNKKRSLMEVITQKDNNGNYQYNAFGGNNYNRYYDNKLDQYSDDVPKANLVNKVLKEIENGTFKPTTKEIQFYHRFKDNSFNYGPIPKEIQRENNEYLRNRKQ